MSANLTPWAVPETWTWVLAGDFVDIVGGGTPSTANASNFEGGSVPWITPADLSGFAAKYIGRGRRQITPGALRNSAARLLPKGSVLFSSRAPIGYVAIASNPIATNQGFKSFVLPSGLDPEYVYYYLQRAKGLALALASGTTFQEISARQAAKIPLAIAPAQEQGRIASAIDSYFSRLDDAVASLERAQRNLTRYRASVLKAAVEGRLVPTEAELARAEGREYEPASVLLERILAERRRRWEEAELAKMKAKGKVPRDDGWKARYEEPVAPDTSELPELRDGWCWASVGQLGEVVTGTTPSTKDESLYGEEVPFFKPTDLDAGYNVINARQFLSQRGAEHARVLPVESVLVTCIGATIGKTGLSRVPCATNQQINALVPEMSLRASRYLFWVFCSPFCQRHIVENASSTTLPILNKSRFEQLPVPLPPISEQKRIVIEVERIDSVERAVAESNECEQHRVSRLRQSILKWAFEGSLVDQDPTDEPASKLLERIKSERVAQPVQSPVRHPRRATSKRKSR